MAVSTALRNQILDKVFRNVDFTIGTVTISLHIGDPGTTGANEVTGGSYARQTLTCSPAASGNIENSGTLSFPGMPACTLTHFSAWDGSTWLCSGPISPNKTINAGVTYQFLTGNLDFSIP